MSLPRLGFYRCREPIVSDELTRIVTIISIVGAGLTGGVFFAFSTFVMKGLDRLPSPQAIAAMNAINKAAPSDPWFMTALFGTAVTCVVVAMPSLRHLDDPAARYRVVAAVLYLIAIVLTGAYHVPRNDRLAAMDPASAEAASAWARYVADWTSWNHVRTIGPLTAALALILSLRRT